MEDRNEREAYEQRVSRRPHRQVEAGVRLEDARFRKGMQGSSGRRPGHLVLVQRGVFRSQWVGLIGVKLKDGDGDGEALDHLVEQPTLLPAGAGIRAQADQNVVRRKVSGRIFESEKRVISRDRAASLGTQLGYVTQHSLQTLVCLLARAVGGGGDPFRSSRQSGRDDEDLLGGGDQLADPEWQILRAARGLSRGDEKSSAHRHLSISAIPLSMQCGLFEIWSNTPGMDEEEQSSRLGPSLSQAREGSSAAPATLP